MSPGNDGNTSHVDSSVFVDSAPGVALCVVSIVEVQTQAIFSDTNQWSLIAVDDKERHQSHSTQVDSNIHSSEVNQQRLKSRKKGYQI